MFLLYYISLWLILVSRDHICLLQREVTWGVMEKREQYLQDTTMTWTSLLFMGEVDFLD